jgi:hypothetical protein
MWNLFSIRKSGDANDGAAPRARTSPWHWLIGALAIVSFLFVMQTASTHYHADAADEVACAVCGAVDQVADLHVAPVAPATLYYILSFQVPPGAHERIVSVDVALMPPSCGPPSVLS